MFKQMTVGKKIVLGFTALLVLLIAVWALSFQGLNRSSKGFSEYRRTARNTNLVGRLQANMLMARMEVKNFIITGSDRDQQGYQAYAKKMAGFLAEAQEKIKNPERAAKIDHVEKVVNEYDTAFGEVVDFKDERNKLVNEVLNVKGTAHGEESDGNHGLRRKRPGHGRRLPFGTRHERPAPGPSLCGQIPQ